MYRIIYVKDVEFGALSHDFSAFDDQDAQEKAIIKIEKLKQKEGKDILIRRLERVKRTSDMTEQVTEISLF